MAREHHRAVALLPTAVAGDVAESSHANSGMRQESQDYCGGLPEAAAAAAAGDGDSGGGGDGYGYLDDDKNNMRGWLLTVATLFVFMAFQAATQPPAWIPKDWLETLLAAKRSAAAAAGGAISSSSRGEAVMALAYLFFNTLTFSMALTLVVLLLVVKEKSSTRGRTCLLLARGFGVKLAVAVSCSFAAVGSSGDSRVLAIVSAIMAMYAFCVVLLWAKGATFLRILSSRGARRS